MQFFFAQPHSSNVSFNLKNEQSSHFAATAFKSKSLIQFFVESNQLKHFFSFCLFTKSFFLWLQLLPDRVLIERPITFLKVDKSALGSILA